MVFVKYSNIWTMEGPLKDSTYQSSLAALLSAQLWGNKELLGLRP